MIFDFRFKEARVVASRIENLKSKIENTEYDCHSIFCFAASAHYGVDCFGYRHGDYFGVGVERCRATADATARAGHRHDCARRAVRVDYRLGRQRRRDGDACAEFNFELEADEELDHRIQSTEYRSMRVHEFLNLVAQETRAGLPRGLGGFRTWKRYTLVQLFYSRRSVHYEVWVRGKERMLEIGLHCEADRATNSALLEVFDAHLFEIKDALGERMEAEQWTSSWTRVHELM